MPIQKKYINCRGKLLDVSVPRIMGILNVTPDSFYDGGKYRSEDTILKRAEAILEEGGSIIDIGGVSTRPGAATISVEEELIRVVPVVQLLRRHFPEAVLSVDTYRAQVVHEVVREGADWINDVSGGTMDADMINTISRLNVPYVLMHMQGTPATMQEDPQYEHVVRDLCRYFSEKLDILSLAGVKDVILDPGYGFGKSLEHNYTLLKYQEVFRHTFGLPLMAGLSRKSMINKVTGTGPADSLGGSVSGAMLALMNGANILRVHDVRETVQAVKLFSYYQTIP